MIKRLSLFCMSLLMPYAAAAGTIVTWQSVGEVGFSQFAGHQDTRRVPPPGTPYQLIMSFDPSSMTPTVGSPPGSNCFRVSVTGSMSLGATTFATSGTGFTHAQLPGTNCTPGWLDTQFLMGLSEPVGDNPWPALNHSFMELWYTDLLVRDAFPDVPTPLFNGGFQIRDMVDSFIVNGALNLQAVDVEQPAAVPEPGTLTLFGLGLAAVARKIRRR